MMLAGAILSSCGTADTVDTPTASTDVQPPGQALGSCVQQYSMQTLAERTFAFDGTVTRIEPVPSSGQELGYAPVTFEVHEWFRGGGPRQVVTALPAPDAVLSDDFPAYTSGSRLLVSGEPRWGGEPLNNPVGWMCGFTRPYEERTASQWRGAMQSSNT